MASNYPNREKYGRYAPTSVYFILNDDKTCLGCQEILPERLSWNSQLQPWTTKQSEIINRCHSPWEFLFFRFLSCPRLLGGFLFTSVPGFPGSTWRLLVVVVFLTAPTLAFSVAGPVFWWTTEPLFGDFLFAADASFFSGDPSCLKFWRCLNYTLSIKIKFLSYDLL